MLSSKKALPPLASKPASYNTPSSQNTDSHPVERGFPVKKLPKIEEDKTTEDQLTEIALGSEGG
jgi:hypothetical protein